MQVERACPLIAFRWFENYAYILLLSHFYFIILFIFNVKTNILIDSIRESLFFVLAHTFSSKFCAPTGLFLSIYFETSYAVF